MRSGGWRRNVQKAKCVNQGDLYYTRKEFMFISRKNRRTNSREVRMFIVVMKRGNARGAKGHRKVDMK